MNESVPKKRRFRWRLDIVLWGAFIIFVVYPIACGPIFWLVSKNYLPMDPVVAFYSPVSWVADHYKPLADFFYWYGRLWGL